MRLVRASLIPAASALLAAGTLPAFNAAGKIRSPDQASCPGAFECTGLARNVDWTCQSPCAEAPGAGHCYLGVDGKPVYSYDVEPTAGDDADPGIREAPFKTIRAGMLKLRPGDILFLRGGQYAEIVDSRAYLFPSGLSWDEPVVVTGVPGEVAVIAPTTGCEAVVIAQSNLQFITLENLVVDGSKQCVDSRGNGVHDIRLIRNEVKNVPGTSIGLSAETTRVEIRECKVHGNAYDPACITNGGACVGQIGIGGHGNRVEGCEIFDAAAYGVLVYASGTPSVDDNVIVGNTIYRTGKVSFSAAGIYLIRGRRNLVANNVLYSNAQGIQSNYKASENFLFNNTVYNSQFIGILLQDGSGTQVLNNILYRNPTNLHDLATSTRAEDNFTDDPSFVGPGINDFRLKAESLAIDKGQPLESVPNDADGVPRPQGSAYDLGAYEYVAK